MTFTTRRHAHALDLTYTSTQMLVSPDPPNREEDGEMRVSADMLGIYEWVGMLASRGLLLYLIMHPREQGQEARLHLNAAQIAACTLTAPGSQHVCHRRGASDVHVNRFLEVDCM